MRTRRYGKLYTTIPVDSITFHRNGTRSMTHTYKNFSEIKNFDVACNSILESEFYGYYCDDISMTPFVDCAFDINVELALDENGVLVATGEGELVECDDFDLNTNPEDEDLEWEDWPSTIADDDDDDDQNEQDK